MNGKISLKRKALGSFVGGILFTVSMTWVFVGLILSLAGIRLGMAKRQRKNAVKEIRVA